VIETVRVVYGCEKCRETVIMAPGPNWLVEKGSCSEGVLAHVVVSKYVDHLPLYRLERIFSRQGIEVSPSTLVSWIGHVANHIGPVVRCMEDEVKKAECINTDDTGIPVLFNHGETKKDSAHHGYMWVYRVGNDVAVFKYSPDRSGKRPEEYLKDYKGYLQCDAFSGYGRLFQTPHILEVNCWQHAKRKFIEAEQNDRIRSEKAVGIINMLYRVEHIADESGLNEGERLELRREVSAGIVETLKAWLHAEKDRALPKSPIGKAIAYTLNQWKGLTRFLEDGSLQLDNNAAERAMRHVVMGRKNWLFAGSEEGARKMAGIYSLLYTCQMQKIDPFVYLKDILTKIANHHPQKEIYDLTPKGWKEKRKLMAEAQNDK
jgi:hypothetical protein